ncbi:uncharacterized protein METZ01_LOCUS17476 [marine metagenome]|jgi:hypothetical protein|uniref:DUF385 domain-containing protein n=1 Tax=marine metagenome TaxID=408172 RepID=A0A381PCA8_9ZZZZ|tara:strand:+ start:587 stop:997 length:411 start_codon:yes stop_codon:yes gene_type:complete
MKAAKAVKIVTAVFLFYIGIVIVFESLLGYFQPQAGTAMVITTFDNENNGNDRVVARLESNGMIYVAANHWPRAWYRQATTNPRMNVSYEGEKIEYRAIPVEGEEHGRVDSEHSLGLVFRILTGFPPRYFVRLDRN